MQYSTDPNNHLILILTYQCNLRCTYCPTVKYNSTMNWETAKKALDIFNTHAQSKRQISFFGGETLLQYPLMKKIIEYNKKFEASNNTKQSPTYKYIITTNGLFLKPERMQFFKENNCEVRVSLDGDPKTQKIGRGEEAQDAIQNLSKDDKAYIIANMVIAPFQVNKFMQNVKYLMNQGIQKFNLLPAFFQPWTKAQILELHNQFQQFKDLLKENPHLYLRNKDLFLRSYLFNEGYVIDTNGDVFNSNKIMTSPYLEQKIQWARGNIHTIQSFKELGPIKKIPNLDGKKHKINLVLDQMLTHLVESA